MNFLLPSAHDQIIAVGTDEAAWSHYVQPSVDEDAAVVVRWFLIAQCNTILVVGFKLQWRMLEVFRYRTVAGKEPVTDWLASLRDKRAQAKVRIRVQRLASGNFGDSEPVGAGVFELREHLGAGYRVYYGRHGKAVVILLCGGTKKTQPSDITAAKDYWEDWKRRQK